MNTTEILKKLTAEYGGSGDELFPSQTAAELLKEFTDDITYDNLGSVIAHIGKRCDNKPTVLIDAHIDEISMIVTHITNDGFLKVGACGGIDAHILPAQQAVIFGKKRLLGIVATKPPHLAKGDDAKKVMKVTDISIDTGLSGDEAKELISLGDRVYICSSPAELCGGKFTSRAIDDRAGVTAILYSLELLSKEKELPVNLTVSFSSQEEVGTRGAKAAGFLTEPDYAIAVDVSFAHTSDADEIQCGKLGKGVMIGVSPTLDKEMSKALTDCAEKAGIPYQIEVMAGTTGTNADAISVSGKGVRACTLSIPIRYMHTPVEVAKISDIEATGRLIYQYIKEFRHA